MTDDSTPRHLPAIIEATVDAHAITPAQPYRAEALSVDALVTLWLHEQRSHRTKAEYEATIEDFRALLAQADSRLDLDAGDHALLARMAQVWSKRPTRQRGHEGREPSVAMQARRYAILSSFYLFAMRAGMQEWKRDRKTGEMYRDEIEANPLRKVKRPRVQRYADAQPIEPRELMACLRRIDRTQVEGMRDYALLTIALVTGRRIAELANMRGGALTVGRDHRVTVRFEAKGGKIMRDRLDAKTSDALLTYLRAAYGLTARDDLSALAADAPIWLAFARVTAAWERDTHAGARQPMTTSGLRRIFFRRIGTSKAHATRHSFTMLMDKAGASLSDIQARLGHASAKTTADYMNELKSADNPFIDQLAAMLGL